jgi:hypothetical protein
MRVTIIAIPTMRCALRAERQVDSYGHGREIVERKNSQLGGVNPDTAKGYIDSLRRKYARGESIADSAENRAEGIAGKELSGRHILEFPPQTKEIPESVIEHAKKYKVVIRDTLGKVHTT